MSPAGGEKDASGIAAGGPAPVRRRRSWFRRLVRGLVGLGLLVVLLLAFVLTVLHTPAGSTAARVLLEQWGSRAIAGELRLGNLELHLWKRQAAVTAASLRRDGVTVDVQRIEVAWPSQAGPHVRLLRPRIVVRDTGAPEAKSPPAGGLAAQPWRALERLAGAEVVEGRLELRDAKGDPWLVLGRLDAEMTSKDGRREVAVRVADGAAGWPEGGLRVRPVDAQATLALGGGTLVLEAAHLATGSSSIDLRGGLDRLSPIGARASARVAIDGALVAAVSPGTVISGRVDGDVEIEAKDDRTTGTRVVKRSGSSRRKASHTAAAQSVFRRHSFRNG